MRLPPIETIVNGIAIGIKLVCFRASALGQLDNNRQAVYNSFWAAGYLLPVWMLSYFLLSMGLVAGLVSYVIAWTLWPVIADYVVRYTGRHSAYLPYVQARNWTVAVACLVYALPTTLYFIGFWGTHEYFLCLFILMVWGIAVDIWLVVRVLGLELRFALALACLVYGIEKLLVLFYHAAAY